MLQLSTILLFSNYVDKIEMSIQQSQYIVNNGRRFEVTISNYQKSQNHIVYEASIIDTAFLATYSVYFRFKVLRKLHKQMSKQLPNDLPEFPKTKSFCLWNKTNSDPRLIEQRIRDLQYYLTKLLNNFNLLKLYQMRYILKAICSSNQKRSYSQKKMLNPIVLKQKNKECPEFRKRQKIGINLL